MPPRPASAHCLSAIALVAGALASPSLRYDKSGEEHFNLISALHKSIRNSDADAALYWLARMLEGGEENRAQRIAEAWLEKHSPGELGRIRAEQAAAEEAERVAKEKARADAKAAALRGRAANS